MVNGMDLLTWLAVAFAAGWLACSAWLLYRLRGHPAPLSRRVVASLALGCLWPWVVATHNREV